MKIAKTQESDDVVPLINWLIDFYGISTNLGLFYT